MERKLLYINEIPHYIIAEQDDTLLKVLREQMLMLGTKKACGTGHCGACSVIMDGKVIRSCVTKMRRVPAGARITTVEGVGTPANLHPIQKAFIVHGAPQCGFCMPGFVVSSKALLDTNLTPTREDVRNWFQKHHNACRCNSYKPVVDGVMDAAKVLRGEMDERELDKQIAGEEQVWNTRHVRPSAIAKVTGTCEYGADLGMRLPKNTLRLAMVQADVSHANIKSIDTGEAEKMPGVYKILTHKDVKGNNRINGLVVFPYANKTDGFERPILCDEKVFQYGDAIALVCADTEENARAAAAKVKVEYELLPAYMNALEAAAEDAIEIHPGIPNVYFEQKLIKGEEVDPIFEKAPYVAEDNFYVQRQPHMTIEPDVGFAWIDDDGVVVVQSKSIALYIHHAMICEGLGLPEDKLRIIQNPMGGTFGYKLSPTLEALCAVAAIATGRPVYLAYDYQQFITYTGKRSPIYGNIKMAADEDGKLQAIKSDFLMDHGPYSEFGDLLTVTILRNIGACYDIPNNRGFGRSTFTNHAFGSAFRAYGSPQARFGTEIVIDQMAEKVGLDPLEFRYRNVYHPGSTTPTGDELDVHPLPELLDMMRPKYQEALERAAKESTADKKRGVGLSVGTYNCGDDTADYAESDIELMPDGTFAIYNTWEDHGQGSDMGTLATAHQALRPMGVRPEQINLLNMNDTGLCPNSGAAAGSRSQFMVGNAIVDSCGKLMEAMRKPDGTFRTYEEMAAENIPTRYRGSYSAAPLCSAIDPETSQYKPVVTYMYGVFMSEVEVDVNTGEVKVVSMTMNADVGVIANRLVVEGQMLGGMAQGIGLALSEDFEDPKKDNNLKACGFPFIKDVPDKLEVNFLETPRANGPFGAAGCGELPLTAPHASIINGIYHAVGVRIRNLPARKEKVLAAIKAKAGKAE